eukprot:10887468-Alexandrium_andersonii.AAC.1
MREPRQRVLRRRALRHPAGARAKFPAPSMCSNCALGCPAVPSSAPAPQSQGSRPCTVNHTTARTPSCHHGLLGVW